MAQVWKEREGQEETWRKGRAWLWWNLVGYVADMILKSSGKSPKSCKQAGDMITSYFKMLR